MYRLLCSRGLNSARGFNNVLKKNLSDDAPPKETIPNVKGLSNKVFSVPNTEVGPGASKTSDYKNPEYFSYNKTSYFEAEIEMLRYRNPQPSSVKSS